MSGPTPAERALRMRYWEGLRARRRATPEHVDLAARRRERERVWRTWADGRLAQSAQNHDIWRSLVAVRRAEAGADPYVLSRWAQLGRTGYTPDDLQRFHYAIEEWVSPVLLRIHEERRVVERLKTLRPWDVSLVPVLEAGAPLAGRGAELLAAAGKRPEVRWLVRSLAALEAAENDETRAALFERFLQRWAEAAMIDSFEAWAYTGQECDADAARCGDRWRAGWLLYLPGIDWTGLETEQACEWHDRWPIFVAPFHAIEPAIGQLAAVQLWAARDRDASAALASLGAALDAPDLRMVLQATGVEMALDEHGVREGVDALEEWVQRFQ